MSKVNKKEIKRKVRRLRIRAKIKGSAELPRLSVFRSNAGMYLQLIDDAAGKTIISASTKELKKDKIKKIEASLELGRLLAKKAVEKNIKKAVFDRGGYKYTGRVKAAAEGAREGGLVF